MTLLSLQWLIAYCAQIAAVVTCAVLLARLLRLSEPQVRWSCYEGVLFLCLCLPLLQMHAPPAAKNVITSESRVAQSLEGGQIAESTVVAQGTFKVNLQAAIAFLLVGGILLRAGWLLLGFRALYRLRRTARQWTNESEQLRELQDEIGADAELLISDQLRGAISFGLRSSVILLPPQFGEMNEGTQAAILSHELIHIRRKDWLFTVIEECLLTLFWFHPAIWWLVREVQLAREESVDLEAIRCLNSTDQYVEALVAAAEIKGKAYLRPATSFVWRGELARRVASIFAAEVVSRRRRTLSVAGVLIGTLLVLYAALVCFPVRFPVHAQSLANEPITIESGGDHLLRRAPIEYPRWVQEERVEGLVEAEVSIDKLGRVLDAHVVDGPEDLRRPVLRSILDWRYDPRVKEPGIYQIAIRFTLPDQGYPSTSVLFAYPSTAGVITKEGAPPIFFFNSIQRPATTDSLRQMVENTRLAENGELSGRIEQIRKHGAAERIDLHLPIAVGENITPESIQDAERSLHKIDPGLVLGLAKESEGQVVMHIFSGGNLPDNAEDR